MATLRFTSLLLILSLHLLPGCFLVCGCEEPDWQAPFIGSYQLTQTCENGFMDNPAIEITRDSDSNKNIVISGYFDKPFTAYAENLSSLRIISFTMPTQVDGKPVKIEVEGWGTLNGNHLTLLMTYRIGNQKLQCEASGDKK